MTDEKYKLAEGRTSLANQAKARGLPNPEGKTVAQIEALGFDIDPSWPREAFYRKSDKTETGYGLFVPFSAEVAVTSLAT